MNIKEISCCLFFIFTLLACDKESPQVTSINLDKEQLSLKVGEEYQFKVTHNPPEAKVPLYTWTVSKTDLDSGFESIIEIDQHGKAYAIAEGEVEIVAQTPNVMGSDGQPLSAKCKVIISPVVAEGIEIDKKEIVMDAGVPEYLTVNVIPVNTTYKEIVWSSSAPDIVTVSPQSSTNAIINAIKYGESEIIATLKHTSLQAKCKVKVNPIKVQAIGLNFNAREVKMGESFLLIVSFNPSNSTNKNIVFKSSDPNVATVDKNGLVSPVKPGKCVIKAISEDGGFESECQVIVNSIPLSYIELDQYSYEIEIGQEIKIPINIIPENATNKNVSWSSSNPRSVTVDQEGTVKGVYLGFSQIVITAEDNGYSTSCAVSVWDFQRFIKEIFPASSLIINGAYLSGSLDIGVKNNSSKTINITSFSIMETKTYTTIEKITESSNLGVLRPGEYTSIRYLLEGVYDPVFIWKYNCEGEEYEKRFQYRGNN